MRVLFATPVVIAPNGLSVEPHRARDGAQRRLIPNAPRQHLRTARGPSQSFSEV